MPAIGSRGPLAPRELQRAAARPAPPVRSAPAPTWGPLRSGYVPAPPRAPSPVFSRRLPAEPFRPAVQQAQRHVERAQAALPKQPTPIIPHVANPNPQQTHIALTMVRNAMRQALGPNPTAAQLGRYQTELANDPRQRDFLNTVAHYVRSAEAHLSKGSTLGPLNYQSGAFGPLAANPIEQASRLAALPQAMAELRREREPQATLPLIGTVRPLQIASALSNVHLAPSGFLGNIVNEAFDIPGQTFLTGAIAGSALRKGIGSGDWSEAGQLGKNVLSQVEHPLRTLKQAPLSAALMLGGVEGGVGGAVGRVVAAGGRDLSAAERLGALLRPRFSPRPDKRLYGESGLTGGPADAGFAKLQGERITGRTYNPDPLREAMQKVYERKVLPAFGQDPFAPTGRLLKREMVGGTFKVGRADLASAAGEDTRRGLVRWATGMLEAVRPHGPEKHVVPALVAQNVVRSPATAIADSKRVLAMWKGAAGELKGGHLKANRTNVARLEAAIDAMRSDPAAIGRAFAAGDRARGLSRPLTAMQVHGGKLLPEQLRAALFPYAQVHMGAQLGEIVPPDALAAHTAAEAEHAAAQAQVRDGETAVRRYENLRAKATGRQEARAAPGGPVQMRRAAEGGGTHLDAIEGRLRGAKESLRVAKAHAQDAASNRLPKPTPVQGMRAADGGYLPDEAVLAHMKANGLGSPGFVSHKLGIAGRGSYFQSVLRNPSIERFARSGESFRKGIADHGWEALGGSLARQASESAQLEVRRGILNRFSVGGPYRTAELARLAARNAEATAAGDEPKPTGLGRLVPVHLGSGQILSKGLIEPRTNLADYLQRFGLAEHSPVDAHELGHYALIPEKVAKRLEAHDRALGTSSSEARALQVYQQGFRRAKLNTSVPHIAGVTQEQAIRLATEGVLPGFTVPTHVTIPKLGERRLPVVGGRDVGGFAGVAGAKLARNLHELGGLDRRGTIAEPSVGGAEYRHLASSMANRGGQAGSQRWTDVTRTKGDQFAKTSGLGYVLHGADAAASSQAARVISGAWRGWSSLIEGNLAHLEHATRNAFIGKALRDSGIITSYRQLIHMQDDAVKALIRGKLTPNMADSLAHRIDDMGGNWNRQTPFVRKAVGNVAPFGLWWLNSMRWLYRMPVTHPVKSAIAAALYQATREHRNKEGQGYDAAHPVPTFLQGTIKTSLPLLGKGEVAPTYYSPGGTLGAEAGKTAADLLFPAVTPLIAEAKGQNPLSGAKLETPNKRALTPAQMLLNVLGAGATGPVPFATQAEKLLTMGGKPYGTANVFTEALSRAGLAGPQVKPGTERPVEQVLGKLISPTRFDFPSAGRTSNATGQPSAAEIRDAERKALTGPSKSEQQQVAEEIREAERKAAGVR